LIDSAAVARPAPLLLALLVVPGGAAACSERVIDAVKRVDAAPPPRPAHRSCAEIRAANPTVPDGRYLVDPDGPGGAPPIEVTCEMTGGGGGWTRILEDDFSAPPTGFSRAELTTCGAFGSILGGYQMLGFGDTVTKAVPLAGIPHQEIRVRFEFVVIDSWDGELAFAELDGARLWERRCSKGTPGNCQQTSDQCGWSGPDPNDGKVLVDVTVPHARDEAALTFGAVLDQARGDESWGLDNLSILLR
jgi:hypothetical protein